MTEVFDTNKVNIPYGVLHDQNLVNIEYNDKELILSFRIELYKEDYTEEIYNKYKDYNYCEMKVELSNTEDCYCYLCDFINKKGEFSGIEIELERLKDFLFASNYTQFLSCMANSNSLQIDFATSFYDAKGKYRKYKHYSSLDVTLPAKNVTWEWR